MDVCKSATDLAVYASTLHSEQMLCSPMCVYVYMWNKWQ